MGMTSMARLRASFAQVIPRTSPTRFAVLVVALFLMRGVAILCVLPPLEGWDEYQHVAYIEFVLEHGRPPVSRTDEARMSDEFLAAATRLPQPVHMLSQTAGSGAVGYADFWKGGPLLPDSPRVRRTSLYQAQQGPLYYRLVAPVYRAVGGASELPRSIAVLRCVNLLLGTASLALVLWVLSGVAFLGERTRL